MKNFEDYRSDEQKKNYFITKFGTNLYAILDSNAEIVKQLTEKIEDLEVKSDYMVK